MSTVHGYLKFIEIPSVDKEGVSNTSDTKSAILFFFKKMIQGFGHILMVFVNNLSLWLGALIKSTKLLCTLISKNFSNDCSIVVRLKEIDWGIDMF